MKFHWIQTLLELETDKATAPVPSTSAGKVASILVNEGDVVKEGMVVVQLDGANGTQSATPATAQRQRQHQYRLRPLQLRRL